MAELDITRITVTPMQRLIVEWEPVSPEPANYTITATNAGHTVNWTVSGSVNVARIPDQFPRLRTYTVTVTDGTDTGAASYIPIEVKSGSGILLRQALFDALHDANITDAIGRPVAVLHNGLYSPDDVKDGETLDVLLPAIEVLMPTMSGAPEIQSYNRSVETWEVPFRIWDEGEGSDPESIAPLYHLFELVQAAIENTGDLKLSGRGVMWRGWDFSEPVVMEDRDRLSGLEASITIPIQRVRAQAVMA